MIKNPHYTWYPDSSVLEKADTVSLPSEGIFETFLLSPCRKSLGIIALDLHLERLSKSQKALGLLSSTKDCVKEEICGFIQELTNSDSIHGVMRIVLTKYRRFYSYTPISSWERLPPSINMISMNLERQDPEHKHLNFTNCIKARELAVAKGAHAGLLVDSDGYVREADWASLIWCDRNGNIFTVASKVLPGITVEVLKQISSKGIQPKEILLRDLLSEASELIITNAVNGVVVVKKLDDREFCEYEISSYLREQYNSILKTDSDPLLTIL